MTIGENFTEEKLDQNRYTARFLNLRKMEECYIFVYTSSFFKRLHYLLIACKKYR